MNYHDLDDFTQSYINTALWSSIDDDDIALNENYGFGDIDDNTLKTMIADCKAFQEECREDISHKPALAGHDFWLTRNQHGTEFWDGDWPGDIGERLTKASHAYSSFELLVGGDTTVIS